MFRNSSTARKKLLESFGTKYASKIMLGSFFDSGENKSIETSPQIRLYGSDHKQMEPVLILDNKTCSTSKNNRNTYSVTHSYILKNNEQLIPVSGDIELKWCGKTITPVPVKYSIPVPTTKSEVEGKETTNEPSITDIQMISNYTLQQTPETSLGLPFCSLRLFHSAPKVVGSRGHNTYVSGAELKYTVAPTIFHKPLMVGESQDLFMGDSMINNANNGMEKENKQMMGVREQIDSTVKELLSELLEKISDPSDYITIQMGYKGEPLTRITAGKNAPTDTDLMDLGRMSRPIISGAIAYYMNQLGYLPVLLHDSDFTRTVFKGTRLMKALKKIYTQNGSRLPTISELITDTAGLPKTLVHIPEDTSLYLNKKLVNPSSLKYEKLFSRRMRKTISLLYPPGTKVHTSDLGYQLLVYGVRNLARKLPGNSKKLSCSMAVNTYMKNVVGINNGFYFYQTTPSQTHSSFETPMSITNKLFSSQNHCTEKALMEFLNTHYTSSAPQHMIENTLPQYRYSNIDLQGDIQREKSVTHGWNSWLGSKQMFITNESHTGSHTNTLAGMLPALSLSFIANTNINNKDVNLVNFMDKVASSLSPSSYNTALRISTSVPSGYNTFKQQFLNKIQDVYGSQTGTIGTNAELSERYLGRKLLSLHSEDVYSGQSKSNTSSIIIQKASTYAKTSLQSSLINGMTQQEYNNEVKRYHDALKNKPVYTLEHQWESKGSRSNVVNIIYNPLSGKHHILDSDGLPGEIITGHRVGQQNNNNNSTSDVVVCISGEMFFSPELAGTISSTINNKYSNVNSNFNRLYYTMNGNPGFNISSHRQWCLPTAIHNAFSIYSGPKQFDSTDVINRDGGRDSKYPLINKESFFVSPRLYAN